MILLATDYSQSRKSIVNGIERNPYGEGSRSEEIVVRSEGHKKQEIEVEVSEQMYEDEEIDAMFQRCVSKLETEILGENKSPDSIT